MPQQACYRCRRRALLAAQAAAGREYDERFLSDLPAGVDPCGENGEFHTFDYDGPVFRRPLRVERGEQDLREGRFYYCDLLGAGDAEAP